MPELPFQQPHRAVRASRPAAASRSGSAAAEPTLEELCLLLPEDVPAAGEIATG